MLWVSVLYIYFVKCIDLRNWDEWKKGHFPKRVALQAIHRIWAHLPLRQAESAAQPPRDCFVGGMRFFKEDWLHS